MQQILLAAIRRSDRPVSRAVVTPTALLAQLLQVQAILVAEVLAPALRALVVAVVVLAGILAQAAQPTHTATAQMALAVLAAGARRIRLALGLVAQGVA